MKKQGSLTLRIIADKAIPGAWEAFKGIGLLRLLDSREIDAAAVKQCDVLIVRYVTRVDQRLLAGSTVKFVGTVSAGTDHIDLGYLKQRKIAFSAAPGSNAESVAEYVMAAMLCLHRRGRINLSDATLGIIGVGNVGNLVAQKAKALGMTVLLNDPPKRRATGDKSFKPLWALMKCDILTIHTPLTFKGRYKTAGMFDRVRLARLKRGTIVINSARGGIVREDQLKKCLASGRLGAVLDVWENEPNVDAELAMLADIATPHVAGLSQEARLAAVSMIHKAACSHFKISQAWMPPANRRVPLFFNGSGRDTLYSVLQSIVRETYDIEKDSTDFIRNIEKSSNIGRIFTDFRKQYLHRVEFSSREIFLSGPARRFARALYSIGFKPRQGLPNPPPLK